MAGVLEPRCLIAAAALGIAEAGATEVKIMRLVAAALPAVRALPRPSPSSFQTVQRALQLIERSLVAAGE